MMSPATYNSGGHKRASVLISAIVILAILFIIGITFLIIAKYDRKSTEQEYRAREIRFAASAIQARIVAQLREDIVGQDGIPYNRSWGQDRSLIEDYADFAGLAGENR